MFAVIKLLGTEVNCNSTPSAFGGNKLIRVANCLQTNSAVITHKANSTVTIGTISLCPLQTVIIEKTGTDTLESNQNASVFAVPVAYKG